VLIFFELTKFFLMRSQISTIAVQHIIQFAIDVGLYRKCNVHVYQQNNPNYKLECEFTNLISFISIKLKVFSKSTILQLPSFSNSNVATSQLPMKSNLALKLSLKVAT
jgi:hypothetical protein